MRTVTRIGTKRSRDALAPRRKPYWYKLARDRHLGLRKLTSHRPGTWIAGHRDHAGNRQLDFDAAKAAAEACFRDRDQGGGVQDDAGALSTLTTARMCCVRALRTEGRAAPAHDAHMRFRRTIYGTTTDLEFGPPPLLSDATRAFGGEHPTSGRITQADRNAKPRKWTAVAQPTAAVPLSRVWAPTVRRWHLDRMAAGFSKARATAH